ncbi:hypothetical protein SERLA73DRAFT_143741, partial [Serpula lacrymans var. lacrymans S7.3]
MEGVRRWIGAHPTSRVQTSNRRPSSKVEKHQKTHQDPEHDHRSTEAIAKRLLDPIVSNEEKAEYQQYIEQCHFLLQAPPDEAEAADKELYEKFVGKAMGDVYDWSAEVPLNFYASYAEL